MTGGLLGSSEKQSSQPPEISPEISPEIWPEMSPEIEEPVVLFGDWICPFSVRVEFALAQLGISYEVVDVPPTAVRPMGFVLPEEFLANSPRAEIPMVAIYYGVNPESIRRATDFSIPCGN